LLATALFDLQIPPFASASNKNARVGVVAPAFLHDCEPAILHSFIHWQNLLTEHGATLTPIDTSYWEEAMSIYAPIQASEAAAIHAPATNGDFSHFEPTIAERLTWGASLTSSDIQHARQRLATFRQKTTVLFHALDFLILPCAPLAHLVAGDDHSDSRRRILRYTTPMSLAGAPVVTLPSHNGAGIQLAAQPGDDARLLSYAASLPSKP
jgi:Asp-tRNA(Asn)/Glu-tRNA(Gln) amidotransferase A subunit family amidase